MTLDDARTNDIPQVTQAENESLTASSIEKEIWDAVFAMERNKAPGLDGLQLNLIKGFGMSSKLI
jgi:hypothetical protein